MLDRHRQSLTLPKSLLFDLFHPCRVVLLFLVAQCLHHSATTTVRAEANVTVDDGDSRITYSPPGAWRKSEQTQLNYGGSHMLTQNANATAIFNFTGTAIYFLSPLWPYNVNTAISLDSSPASLIDLVDHGKQDRNQGAETVPSSVVWSASKLSDTSHILRISVGAGQSFAIVDALVYTDPSATSTSTATRVVANPSFATSAQASHRKSPVPIALGVLFGLLGLIIIIAAIWYLWRRHKRRHTSEAWTIDGSSYPDAGGRRGVIPGGGAYANGNGYGPPSAYGYDQGQPLPYPPNVYESYGGAPLPPPGIPYPGVPYPGVPPNRAPNRYQPGYTLSTITEKSTPQMADGTRTMPGTPMSGAAGGTGLGPHSPASIQSELGYYTAGSSVGQHSPPVIPGQVGQNAAESQPQHPHQQQQQHRTMGITSQMQMQGLGSNYSRK